MESRPKDFNEAAIDDEGSTEDYGYLSDSDLEDDKDEGIGWVGPVSKWGARAFGLFWNPREDGKSPCEEHGDYEEKGKVVEIPDLAFVTWVQARNPSRLL